MANVEAFKKPGDDDRDEIEVLRENLEMQLRVNTQLLRNYEALLKKFEGEHGDPDEHETVVWSTASPQTIPNNGKIPQGWWIPLASGNIHLNNHAGGTHTHLLVAYIPFFSEGTAEVAHTGGISMVRIVTRIEHEKDGD
jgi:hypothetical protein